MIELTSYETHIIAQYIKYMADSNLTVSRKFLDDFAVIFTHHVDNNGRPLTDVATEQLEISETDLLVLRELIPLLASNMKESIVGSMIHKKLYEELLRKNPDIAVELRDANEYKDPSKEEIAVLLKRSKRRRKHV